MVAAGQWWNGGGSLGGSGTWSPSAGTTNWSDPPALPPLRGARNRWPSSAAPPHRHGGGTTAPRAVGMEFLTTGYTVAGNGSRWRASNGSPTTAIKVEDSAATAAARPPSRPSSLRTQGLDKTGTAPSC